MCDTMAAVGSATLGGAVLFAKNSDREFTEAQYLELIPATDHPAGASVRLTHTEIGQARYTHAVLLSKPHWIWGAEIGANEHGLVIGNEALFSKIEASSDVGIIGMDYLRLGLERAQSVDEAIQVMTGLLREHGQSGNCGFKRAMAYHNSFILADPRGAKVLETVDREWVVTPVVDYYAISNAMTIDNGFAACSPTLQARAIEAGIYQAETPFAFKSVYEDADRTPSGHHRRAQAMLMLGGRNGRLQPSDFFGVLRDHTEGVPIPGRAPPRICSHARENPLGQTTASWVASLAPGKRVHWVTGTAAPCTGLFKPVLFETGLPHHGPRPGAEEDMESLWWRHERLRRFIDAADTSISDAFMEERADLETRFLEEMAACPPVSEPRGLMEARRIVTACWRDALAFENKWFERAVA
jgi:secernin